MELEAPRFPLDVEAPAFPFDSSGDYPHWSLLAQCLVPFLIVGTLLAGALYVKKHFADIAGPAQPLPIQADTKVWERMADTARVEQAVKEQIQVVKVDFARVAIAERHLRSTEPSGGVTRRTAEEQLLIEQRRLDNARNRFEALYENYRQLGGIVDYRGQLPN